MSSVARACVACFSILICIAAGAQKAPVVSNAAVQPGIPSVTTVHDQEPAIIVDREGQTDHLVTAWMKLMGAEYSNASMQIHVSSFPRFGGANPLVTQPEQWTTPQALKAFGEESFSGDPYFAADPNSHKVYLAAHSRSNRDWFVGSNEISLWTGTRSVNSGENQWNWSYASVCRRSADNDDEQSAWQNDKPSVAVPASGTVYVAHMAFDAVIGGNFRRKCRIESGIPVGCPGEIHLHWSSNGEWDSTNMVRIVTGNLQAHSPIVLPDPSGQKVHVVWVDHGAKQIHVTSYENTSTNPLTSASVPQVSFLATNILYPGGSSISGTSSASIKATSFLMARYNARAPIASIGIVWTEQSPNPFDYADIRFASFNPATRVFGTPVTVPTMPHENQWNPALDYDDSGNYLVTWYDSHGATDDVNYHLRAALLSPTGDRLSPEAQVTRTESPGRLLNPASSGSTLGEYQDVRYSAGKWYGSFIQVAGDNRTHASVAQITSVDMQRCPAQAGFLKAGCPSSITPRPYKIRRNVRLNVHTNVTSGTPASYTYEWLRTTGTGAIVTLSAADPPHFGSIVSESMMMTLVVTRHDGACDSVPIRVEVTNEDCVTAPCETSLECAPRVRAVRHGSTGEEMTPNHATIDAGTPFPLKAPAGGVAWAWHRSTATEHDVVLSNLESITVSPTIDTTYWVEVDNGIWYENSDRFFISINVPAPAAAAEPAFQSVALYGTAQIEVVLTPEPATQDGYTFEWHTGDRPPIGALVSGANQQILTIHEIDEDASYWCKVTTPNGVVLYTNVARVFVDCVDTILGTLTPSPSSYISRSDRPLAGATVTGGKKPIHYEWYTRPSLYVPGTLFNIHGSATWVTTVQPLTYIYAKIHDDCGNSATLFDVEFRLCLPTIDSEPADVLVADGASATLTLGTSPAFAGQTVNVNWYEGTDAYEQNSLEDEPAFFTPAIDGGTAKTYYATATSNCGTDTTPYMRGVRSRLVTVRACKNPGITAVAATPAQVRSGGSVTLAVAVTGSDLTYQWYRGNPGDTSAPIATGSAAAVTATTTTTYWVRVTSEGLCSTNSGAVGVDVCTDPVITVQPQSIAIRSGQSTTLSVTSTTPGVTYQWHNATTGAAISTATNSTLTVDPAADAQYYVIVKRGACSVQSATVTVTVCSLSAGITGAQNTTYQQWVTLTATPLNARVPSANAHYTWYQGTGANSSVLNSGTGMTQRSVNPANTTPYWVRIHDGTCTFDSEPVTVSVCIPQITIQPQGTLIQPSQTAILSVATTNIVGRTFRWYIGAPGDISQPAPGASATTSTYTTPALTSTTSYWVRVSTSCTTVDSSAAVISVCQPAAISSITPTRSIRQGASTWHQVYATGSSLTYQWYTGTPGNTGNPITGATLASISVAPTATTTYWARVWTDGLCTKDSGAMVVDVCTDPAITTEPASTTIASGQATTLTVVTSTTGVTYQWYSGIATVINGATGPSLTVSPTTDTNYYCTITRNACSINSATVSVKVCTLGGSLTGGANSAAGQAVLLTATPINPRVSADAATYTWYAGTGANATVFNSGVGMKQRSVTPGATTDYWVRINDGTCTADSNVTRVTVCIPTITAQPQGSSINSGQSATLSVSATGGGLTYRWYIGNPGDTSQPANNDTNATISVTPAATTTYWARVTGCTTADSIAATINVCIPPSVSGPFESGMRTSGGQASVWVTGSGTGLSFQWYVGQSGDTSQPIAGANASTWQFAAQFSLYYWVRVTGTCGTVNSAAVLHSVNPVITQQPAGTTVPSGTTASLGITATGTSLTYQWYRGNSGDVANPMNGATATTPSFMTPAVTTATNYWCKVTSAQAAVNSNHATVSVCTGPAINYIYAQYNNWNYWTITASVATVDTSRGVRYYWYTGVPGNVGQSVFKYEANATIQVLASSQQTWWCRVWYSDNSCYTDTSGATISPMQ